MNADPQQFKLCGRFAVTQVDADRLLKQNLRLKNRPQNVLELCDSVPTILPRLFFTAIFWTRKRAPNGYEV